MLQYLNYLCLAITFTFHQYLQVLRTKIDKCNIYGHLDVNLKGKTQILEKMSNESSQTLSVTSFSTFTKTFCTVF